MRPAEVTVVEVGPRDGLQFESPLSLQHRVELVDALSESGLKHIEVGSFVSPKWVPQMAETQSVFKLLSRKSDVRYTSLVANKTGLQQAFDSDTDGIAVFTAASNSFCQHNINCTVAESLERFKPIIAAASEQKIPVRGYLSCTLGCPYEGKIAIADVVSVANHLFELGCHQIALGDTIGIGTANRAKAMVKAVATQIPISALALHFHDTYGQALANVLACLELGIETIDGAVAGLGGCPYAPGASGNLATEDLIYMLDGLGIEHGVDLDKLITAGNQVCGHLGRLNGSRVAQARNLN